MITATKPSGNRICQWRIESNKSGNGGKGGGLNIILGLQYQARRNNERFRRRLFDLGFWFSSSLPFSKPLLLLVASLLKGR
jgi:hypothetical protein